MASVCGCYHPPSQDDQYFFNHLGNALGKYTQSYDDRFLLICDFNAEDSEPCLSEFLHDCNAESIVTEKICFKCLTNPSVLTYSYLIMVSPLYFGGGTFWFSKKFLRGVGIFFILKGESPWGTYQNKL